MEVSSGTGKSPTFDFVEFDDVYHAAKVYNIRRVAGCIRKALSSRFQPIVQNQAGNLGKVLLVVSDHNQTMDQGGCPD